MTAPSLAEFVRQGDPERFAATMIAPPELREKLWPVYALNLELARAPWAAQNPMLGEMRLQWWADQLGGLATADRPADPALVALQPLMAQRDGLLAPLQKIAETRRADCWAEPFANLDAFLAYLDGTAGAVMRAAQAALDAGSEDLSVFARAQGLSAFLRAVPVLQARGRAPLSQIALSDIADLAAQTRAQLKGAPVPRLPALAVVYPCCGAGRVLAKAARAPELIEAGGLAPSEFQRRAGLLWMGLSGRIG